jgi:hypothetical protein
VKLARSAGGLRVIGGPLVEQQALAAARALAQRASARPAGTSKADWAELSPLPDYATSVSPTVLQRTIASFSEAVSQTGDAVTRIKTLLESVFDQIGSIGGALILFVRDGQTPFPRGVRMIDVGHWTPVQRAARDAYASSPNQLADPFLLAFAQSDLFARPRAAIRHELVDDQAWYSSPHVQDFRKPAEMDSSIYVTIPDLTARAAGQTPDRGWSLSVNRPWGAPPFTTADRELLTAVFAGMVPLLEQVWKEPQTPTESALSSVPLRLRKVLACLIAGDSEKQASAKLRMSPHTVHAYVKALHKHFGVSSRGELMAKAMAGT